MIISNEKPDFAILKERLGDFLSIIDKDKLFTELEIWYHFKTSVSFDYYQIKCDEQLTQLKELFLRPHVKQMFPTIFILFRIYLTFPISNANSERTFSALKRLKNWLRNSMGQERLSNVALLNIESEEADKLEINQLIEIFSSRKNRRIKFF